MLTYTKKELLNIAKTLGIAGRWDMTKDELAEAVDHATPPNGEDTSKEAISKDKVVELKRRTPSMNERDDEGRVVRLGRNLSGNVPYRRKFYFLDTSKVNDEALDAAPNQVKLIIKAMHNLGITSPEAAAQGGPIVERAIESGYLQTKIAPAALFAYYRRLLEALGVREDV